MFDHIKAKLNDQTIDILTISALGFNTEDGHYIRRDDGPKHQITHHDYLVLMGYSDEIHEEFRKLGLLR